MWCAYTVIVGECRLQVAAQPCKHCSETLKQLWYTRMELQTWVYWVTGVPWDLHQATCLIQCHIPELMQGRWQILKRSEWLGRVSMVTCCTLARKMITCSDVSVADCYLHHSLMKVAVSYRNVWTSDNVLASVQQVIQDDSWQLT